MQKCKQCRKPIDDWDVLAGHRVCIHCRVKMKMGALLATCRELVRGLDYYTDDFYFSGQTSAAHEALARAAVLLDGEK